MLNHLSIKNFAIIEDAEINFNKGLNIITGESGSGKSIVVEAISLALGCRADSSYIRTGADKAVIQLVADYLHTDYVITRELSTNGKNICKINGEIVSLAQLQSLTSKIADLHGQYDNQLLLNPALHIAIVDVYEKSTIFPARERVAELYNSYVEITNKINAKKSALEQSKEKLELKQFELNEIESASLVLGEDVSLQEKLTECKNREKIYRAFEEVSSMADNDNFSLLSSLNNIQLSLKEIRNISRDAATVEDELSDIYYRLDDLFSRVRRYKEKLSFSAEDLDLLTERMDTITTLKRKYGNSIEDILNYADKLRKELNSLSTMDLDISSMLIEQERVGDMLKKTTEQLTKLRKRSALALEEKIQNELQDLNFENSRVHIAVERMNKYTSNGIDAVEFMISTNAGEPLKPLAKIASGGELSRIMLAFKSVIGEYDKIDTMIFDEIDNGISGQTAAVVGKKLLAISQKHQIISITHLPQIAALSNHSYKIEKTTNNFTTTATIRHLNDHEKVEEIARLLSGDSVTDVAIENAKSLINK